MEGEIRPVYTFEAPEEVAQSSSGRGLKIFALAVGAIIIVIIVANISGNSPQRSPQQTSAFQPQTRTQNSGNSPRQTGAVQQQIKTRRGQALSFCPLSMQTLTKCWSLDLPASGEWVRWDSPTTLDLVIPTASGVGARGCEGELYNLAKEGNNFNSACGYIDYRATDAKAHTIYEGVR